MIGSPSARHRDTAPAPSASFARRLSGARRIAIVAALVALALGGCARPTRGTAATAAPPVNTAELPVVSDPRVADSLLEDVRVADSTIVVALRYATSDNFTGAPLPGYDANRAFLRREAAAALGRVQRRLAADGLTLKVWDAYRPVRATLAMVDWTRRVGRDDLLRDGYIASRSRHNLGLAIDLTLADRATGRELEMGTPFDTFSAAAHTANASGSAAANRRRLQSVMEREGFTNYDQEWWHYTYSLP
ncbi:MAG TPA: M15 family metallopeptidase, partial [Gemmatimonadaceae bacterium]|nr:M15 family metallopeptidase [Gemmatimonadaceae bacterium]